MVLRLKRDPRDERAAQRNVFSFAASLLLHAIAAYLLFSLATSSSQQGPSESISGSAIVTVSRAAPPAPVPAKTAPPIARPRSIAAPAVVPPVRRVLHVLATFAPSAPPNPTPVPLTTPVPNPPPSQAPIPVTPAPVPPSLPTVAPAAAAPVRIKTPATPAPTPKPAPVTPAPVTPAPEPSALAAPQAPLVSLATPAPLVTSAAASARIPQPAPSGRSQAAKSGPSPAASAGPSGPAARRPVIARPIQPLPATPPPRRSAAAPPHGRTPNERLKNLIPTAEPSFTPASPKGYSLLGSLKSTPPPEPTPPPEVLAATKYLFVENVASQRWKQSFLGTTPEERYVKMYVTSVRRIGFINWCHGWVLRAPIAGSQKWIVEPDESLICSGRLTPFPGSSPEPAKGP